jgi:3-oxoacyl-[acyl-carrier protein] reductase
MLITGTSRGIGSFLVHHYASRGFQVIGCSRSLVDYRYNNYRHYCLDITDEPKVKDMFLDIRHCYNRCDILINNAGIPSFNYALITPLKTIKDVLNINIVGTYLLSREAAKLMQKNKFGRIVNFTSIAVNLNLKGQAIYAASKSAILTFTKIFAKELGTINITVNAVGPNLIKTDFIGSLNEDKLEDLINQQAINRFGNPEDIINVIDFFIKPESNFITGQVIFLGGL